MQIDKSKWVSVVRNMTLILANHKSHTLLDEERNIPVKQLKVTSSLKMNLIERYAPLTHNKNYERIFAGNNVLLIAVVICSVLQFSEFVAFLIHFLMRIRKAITENGCRNLTNIKLLK